MSRKPTRPPAAECPKRSEHTPEPEGYLAWHTWAAAMNQGHRQVRCTGCGLYKVWVVRSTKERVTRLINPVQPCLSCPPEARTDA